MIYCVLNCIKLFLTFVKIWPLGEGGEEILFPMPLSRFWGSKVPWLINNACHGHLEVSSKLLSSVFTTVTSLTGRNLALLVYLIVDVWWGRVSGLGHWNESFPYRNQLFYKHGNIHEGGKMQFSPCLCLLQLFITLDLLAFLKSVIDIDSEKSRQIFQGISNVSQFMRRSNISSKPHGFFKHEMFFLADNRLQCSGFLTSHSLMAKLTCRKTSVFFFFPLLQAKQFVTPFGEITV